MYFFIIDGEQRGPFTINEIQNLKINRGTLTWREGLDDWKEAGKVEELSSILQQTPPPLPANILEKDRAFNVNLGIKKSKFKGRNKPSVDTEKAKTRFANAINSVFKLMCISFVIALIFCLGIGVNRYITAKNAVKAAEEEYNVAKERYRKANQEYEEFNPYIYAINRGLDTISIEQVLEQQKVLYGKNEEEIQTLGSSEADRNFIKGMIALYDTSFSIYSDYKETEELLAKKAEKYHLEQWDGGMSGGVFYDTYSTALYRLDNFFIENAEDAVKFILVFTLVFSVLIIVTMQILKGITWVNFHSKNNT